MPSQELNFWVALAQNEEFWSQIPYWITAIAAISGSLLGAWVGAKLNHSAALSREREARRMQHLERIAEISTNILSKAISFQAPAKRMCRTVQENNTQMQDHPGVLKEYSKQFDELEEAIRATIEAHSLLGIIDENKLDAHVSEVTMAANEFSDIGKNIHSYSPEMVEQIVYKLLTKHNALMNAVRSSWSSNRR